MIAGTQFIFLSLTAKSLDDPTTTKDIMLSNRVGNMEGSRDLVNLIESVSGIGESVGLYSSSNTNPQVSILNVLDSSGYQRRFIDCLDRWCIINQPAGIYCVTYPTDIPNDQVIDMPLGPALQDTLIFSGVVSSVSYDSSRTRLTLAPKNYFREYLNYTIPRAEGVNVNAVGWAAPLVFGKTNVKTVDMISNADGAIAAQYELVNGGSVYAAATDRVRKKTTWISDGKLGLDQITPGDTNSYYVYIRSGNEYVKCKTSSLSTYAVQANNTGGTTGALHFGVGFASMIPMEGAPWDVGAAITGLRVGIRRRSGGITPTTGAVKLSIANIEMPSYADLQSAGPSQPISNLVFKDLGSVAVNAADITTGYKNFNLYFRTPIVIDNKTLAEHSLYILISNDTNGDVEVQYRSQSGFNSRMRMGNGSSGNGWYTIDSTNLRVSGLIYGLRFSPKLLNYSDFMQEGKTIFGVQVHANDATVDTSGLDIVAPIQGFSSGGTYYFTPTDVIEYLSRQYYYLGWWIDNEVFSTGLFAGSATAWVTRQRRVVGAITKKVTLLEAAEMICQNTESKFISARGTFGKTIYGVYVHGQAHNYRRFVYDSDIIKISFRSKTTSSVVNHIDAVYGMNVLQTNYNAIYLAERWWSYSNSLTIGYNDGGAGQAISEKSYELYGKIAKKVDAYDLIADEASMVQVAVLILMMNRHPSMYVDIDLPYEQFKDIRLMDVIRIDSAYSPSEYGSTISPDPYIYTDTSDDNHECSIVNRYGRTRGQGLDCQVHRREVVLNKKDELAILRLSCKINNHSGGVW